MPHSVAIRELFVSAEAGAALRLDADRMAGLDLDAGQLRDLDLLLTGGFFPLKGYLTQADARSVQNRLELGGGAFWPLPLTLRIGADQGAQIQPGQDLALRGQGRTLAILSVTDKWDDSDGGFHLGGPVKGLEPSSRAGLRPNQQRARAREAGHTRLVALGRAHPDYRGVLQHLRKCDLPHLMLDLPDFCDDPVRQALIWAVLARNYGATDIILPVPSGDQQLLNRHRDRAGITTLTDPTAITP